MQPDSLILLEDIRLAAMYIAEDTAGATFDQFIQDRRMRQLVERNFAVIGEAVNRLARLDPEAVARLGEWRQIVGLRNVVVHGYATINYMTLWQTAQVSLPVLRQEVEALLASHEERQP